MTIFDITDGKVITMLVLLSTLVFIVGYGLVSLAVKVIKWVCSND